MDICEANNKKRCRSQNWDENEKAALVAAIKPVLSVVESKKKSTNTNRDKSVAWEKVLSKLSAQGYNRDNVRMREQWQRMKVQAKRNISTYKREMNITGGGPPPTEPSDIDWEIKDLIPYEFEEDGNTFDSDGCVKIDTNSPVVVSTPTTSRSKEPVLLKATPSSSVQWDHMYVDNNIEVEYVEDDGPMQSEASKRKRDSKYEDIDASTPYKKKKNAGLTEYESLLYELNKKRIQQTMDHAEEMHTLKIKNEMEYHKERMQLLKRQYSE